MRAQLLMVALAWSAFACAGADGSREGEGSTAEEQAAQLVLGLGDGADGGALADGGVPTNPEGEGPFQSEGALALPSQLVFGRIQSIGEGCPDERSIEASITDDHVMLINFTKFRAEVMPGKTSHRVLCSLLIGVKIPKDQSFGISSLGYVMSVSFADGVTGKLNATYQMAGRSAARTKFQPIVQSPSDDASFDYTIADEDMAYSPCGDGGEEQVLMMSFLLDLQKSGQGEGEGFVELKRVAVPGRGVSDAENGNPPVELPAIGVPRIKWRSCKQ